MFDETNNGLCCYLYLNISYGHLETICRIPLHQKKRPQRAKNTMDEIHAWDEQDLPDHVFGGDRDYFD